MACERRDPESKGIVEEDVRYIKRNALAGRDDELVRFEDYLAFAPDGVIRQPTYKSTRQRSKQPSTRFQRERSLLRALPAIPYDTDEIVPAVVTPHAATINFDGDRCSVQQKVVHGR